MERAILVRQPERPRAALTVAATVTSTHSQNLAQAFIQVSRARPALLMRGSTLTRYRKTVNDTVPSTLRPGGTPLPRRARAQWDRVLRCWFQPVNYTAAAPTGT